MSGLDTQLYLLTHAHTDHLTGLDNASTNIHIICSEVTKRLVLNYEREKDRIAFDKGTIERRKQAYEGLNARVAQFHQTTVSTGEKRKEDRLLTRDPFHVIPFDKPEPFEVGYDPVTGRKKWVVITMLDANHCPGSAMFLLTDPDKDLTVLHTGDTRLDRPFLDRLERRPALMPYLARFMGMDILQQDTRVDKKESGAAGQGGTFKNKILERIYLDTSAV
ncbi:hypothetical protein QFC19_003696 [Naganishia cerealis]|uniref:Uncharacterized protein n=1 Tax=Naganishia cerealis TaxID=610337 RepID=A0ACC2W179_9TREE|nr:hypothetical protein QFC19_003696 [Naganishia cerealis]